MFLKIFIAFVSLLSGRTTHVLFLVPAGIQDLLDSSPCTYLPEFFVVPFYFSRKSSVKV